MLFSQRFAKPPTLCESSRNGRETSYTRAPPTQPPTRSKEEDVDNSRPWGCWSHGDGGCGESSDELGQGALGFVPV